jgi:excisionase family DNA binding protein
VKPAMGPEQQLPSRSTGCISRATPVDQLPAYLTVEEVAHYLAIGRSSAYEFCRRHGMKIGRLLRVSRDVFEAQKRGGMSV